MAPCKREGEHEGNTPAKRPRRRKGGVDFDTAATQDDSPLLQLPAELRNRIFEMVFEDMTMTWPRIDRTKGAVNKPQGPALLFTCKQVSAEALEIFYANTTFAFGAPKRLPSWQKKIPQDLQRLVLFKVVFVMTGNSDK